MKANFDFMADGVDKNCGLNRIPRQPTEQTHARTNRTVSAISCIFVEVGVDALQKDDLVTA